MAGAGSRLVRLHNTGLERALQRLLRKSPTRSAIYSCGFASLQVGASVYCAEGKIKWGHVVKRYSTSTPPPPHPLQYCDFLGTFLADRAHISWYIKLIRRRGPKLVNYLQDLAYFSDKNAPICCPVTKKWKTSDSFFLAMKY